MRLPIGTLNRPNRPKPWGSSAPFNTWLLSACLALGRATEDEIKAGRMTIEQAG